MKQKLFSITKKDFEIQTFRSGGKGGQHQNTTDSGCRIIHRASGARGESRNHRSQHQNKKEALKRLVGSPEFKVWLARAVYEVTGGKTIDELVNAQMHVENIRIETRETGKWAENKNLLLEDEEKT